MTTEERELLRESLARAVTSAGPGGVRAAVTEFGWHELLDQDDETAVSTLATLQGEHLTEVSMLDDVVLAAAGITGPARVVYPDPPHDEPTCRVDDGTVTVTGVVAAGDARLLTIPALRDGEVVVVSAEHSLPQEDPTGLDPGSGWRRVTATLDIADAQVLYGTDAAAAWRAMRTAGQRALAHELIALGRRMLADAVAHVTTREQFGRKLGGFQAVKHLLADVRLWQECAELAVEAAWEDRLPESARLAKILAGRFARAAAANCQQVLGGMGFTWEHEFHRYMRRALLLEPLLGSAVHLRAALGAHIRAAGIPRLAALS